MGGSESCRLYKISSRVHSNHYLNYAIHWRLGREIEFLKRHLSEERDTALAELTP